MSQEAFSRTRFPAGSWSYHDPRTNFSINNKGMTFDQVVREIIKNRKANPAVVIKHKLSVDEFGAGMDLEKFTKARLGIVDPVSTPPPTFLIPGMSAMGINTVAEIRKLASGAGILMAWNESSEPNVTTEVALKRATTCAACPQNNVAKLTEWLTVPVAASLKQRTARINTLNLSTPLDGKLGLCESLFAPTASLAHVPDAVLKAKVKPATMETVDSKCWLRI